MSLDDYRGQLARDATISGRGAYPESDADELPPDVVSSRLLAIAQWTALAAAVVTFLAGIVTASAVASSYEWGTLRPTDDGVSGMARSGGSLIIIVGVVVGAFLGVLLYTLAQGLLSHPRGGAIALFAVAGVFGAGAVVMLAVPGLVLGDAGNAAARTASSSLSDAEFAGLALVLAATLAAAAGVLTAAGLPRARRRADRGQAERRPAASG